MEQARQQPTPRRRQPLRKMCVGASGHSPTPRRNETISNMAPSSPPVLRVFTGAAPSSRQELRFATRFRIGRAEDCEFRIQNDFVSRYQVEVSFDNGQWRVRDLGSSNGIFIGA